MRIASITPVRNEDWIIGFTGRALMAWVDHAVFLDHNSTDGTHSILQDIKAENPGRVTLLKNEDKEWYEMAHRQSLLVAAREAGATHVATIDADEALSSVAIGRIRSAVQSMGGGVGQLFWAHVWRELDFIRCDRWAKGKWASLVFVDRPEYYWSHRNGYDFHHRHPMGSSAFIHLLAEEYPLLHFQHLVWRRLLAKQALYKMTEVIRWPGRDSVAAVDARYNPTVSEAGISLERHDYLSAYRELMKFANFSDSAAPWQEVQCKNLMKEHGKNKFQGLNLFGVC